ncbi:MAG TPA: hypothetical protein VLA89_03225 [Gemmatimonadales bacterium]|nr:hypothetical protein [Gemmatimonadales bacterium]
MEVDHDYATVAIRQDIDGWQTKVLFHPDRREHDDWIMEMTPETATRLAGKLNKFARVAKEVRRK